MATALVVSIVSVSSASAALDYHFAVFEERTVGTYHGVTGTWDDPTFTGMNCAPPNSTNHMLVAMNLQAYGDHLEYAQIGFIQDKDSSCNTGYYYFWEHWTESLGDVQGVITSITPRGTGRKFGIDKDTTGASCGAGVDWCYDYNINGTTRHTCCADYSGWGSMVDPGTQIECQDNTVDGDCPNGAGLAEVSNLQAKGTGDVWNDWSGMDYACVDYGSGSGSAFAKWVSGTDVKFSFNQSITNSLTSPPCT